jgi:putative redox protein
MPTITASLHGGYRVEMTNGTHRWSADEPVDKGGTDSGPSPYELLMGAVAACTCITLSMYAKRKGIDLESVEARYTYERIHAEDCEFCEHDDRGLIDTVTSDIEIRGNFTAEQGERLEQIATRCPVHKTLEAPVRFDDRVRATAVG